MATEKSYIPTKLGDLLGWAQNLDTTLASIFASVGITSAQSALLHTKVQAFSAAMVLTNNDVTRSPGHIKDRDNKKDDMIAYARTLVNIIQAFPGTTDLMRDDLRITVRKTPGPKGNPGTPYKLLATLTPTGNLVLSWKNNNATGCVYNVWRQTDGTGPYQSLGGSGAKKFTDTSVPSGATQLKYQIQAVRSTGISEFGVLDVMFGQGSSSMTFTEGKPVKAAA